MDPQGHKLIAIIDENVCANGRLEVRDGLGTTFEAVSLEDDKEEDQDDDAEFDEILHRRKLEDPDWGENHQRRTLEAPEASSKVSPLWFCAIHIFATSVLYRDFSCKCSS